MDTLFSNKILDLTLLPIEQCNFRCTYCYEKFADGKMRPGLISGIKRLIKLRAPSLSQLRIGWFGGEPLLAHDVVIDISEYVKQLTSDHPHLTFFSGMSTNGYLLDAVMMKKLVDSGVRAFQVSVDGSKDTHDTLRVKRNGAGSFEIIWNNLCELKKTDIDFLINIRVHFLKDNFHDVLEFCNQLRENFSADSRFKIFFKTVERLGGPNDDTLNVFGKEEAAIAKQKLVDCVGDEIRETLPAGSCYVCYAGKPNAFVIRRDGRIVKCTIGLDDPQNVIGMMHDDGTMTINNEVLRPWLKGAVDQDLKFLRCPRSKMEIPTFT